jgi:hypothetical protein
MNHIYYKSYVASWEWQKGGGNVLPLLIMEHYKPQNIAIHEEQSGSKFTRYTPSTMGAMVCHHQLVTQIITPSLKSCYIILSPHF